ncbi:hypothetical protein MUK42_02943 [Musa troglodytarum]|uniref:Uncharacterized protein n=1 Tax=Musa troglodytarum TaxID=320322 RepID=A0A9E7K1G6_9LILI|nr:hypothetical protein MUK42_02943 [Musa troglodytarum]
MSTCSLIPQPHVLGCWERSEWSSPISSDLDTAMSFSGAISYRATAFIVVAPLLVLVVIYACLWPPGVPTAFFRLHRGANTVS